MLLRSLVFVLFRRRRRSSHPHVDGDHLAGNWVVSAQEQHHDDQHFIVVFRRASGKAFISSSYTTISLTAAGFR